MFLSIIIPVYNDEKYLEECLDSCLNQDISKDDYEIICVDDGSTDRTPEILDSYCERFINIKTIRKQHGIQFGTGRNMGLEAALGDFIWFVDHDDILCCNCLKTLKQKIIEESCERLVFPCYPFRENMTGEERLQAKTFSLPCSWNSVDNVVWCSIVKKSFLTEHNITPRTTRLGKNPGWGTDSFFIYELRQNKIKCAAFDGFPAYYYRIHGNSQDHSNTKETLVKKAEGYANMVALIKQDYIDSDSNDEEGRRIIADTMMLMLRKGLETVSRLPQPYHRQMVKLYRSKGVYPMKKPKEATYTVQQCAKEPSGTGALRNIFRYYSIHPIGLCLATIPYRYFRLKSKIRGFLRKHFGFLKKR